MFVVTFLMSLILWLIIFIGRITKIVADIVKLKSIFENNEVCAEVDNNYVMECTSK